MNDLSYMLNDVIHTLYTELLEKIPSSNKHGDEENKEDKQCEVIKLSGKLITNFIAINNDFDNSVKSVDSSKVECYIKAKQTNHMYFMDSYMKISECIRDLSSSIDIELLKEHENRESL